jgi:hypothetical protein
MPSVQLLRVFRPSKLKPPPPPFDPLDMLQMLEKTGAHAPRRRAVFLVNPFLAAAAAAVAGITVSVEWNTAFEDTLYIHRIDKANAPVLDGDMSDPTWRHAPTVKMFTTLGGNLDGTGDSTVEIRAVHDGEWAYFCFVWDDPTRSLKHLPLWRV